MYLCYRGLEDVVRTDEEIWDRTFSKADEDEVSEVKFNVVGLVCPLVLLYLWVEEVYIRMEE